MDTSTIDGTTSPKSAAICSESEHYVVDENYPSHTPIKDVRLVFHYIMKPNEPMRQNDVYYQQLADRTVAKMNYRFEKHKQMNLPVGNNTPVLPVPFRFVLSPDPDDQSNKGVYVHEDSLLYVFNKDMKAKNSMGSRDQFNKYGVRKGEVINVFFLEHPTDSIPSKTYKASKNGISGGSWVKVASLHMELDKGTCKDADWPADCMGAQFFSLMVHEVGHSLGLSHTWKYNDGCDDTPKHSNCFGLNVPNSTNCDEPSEMSNNVMDYNNQQSALTPCQLGKVYYNFMKPNSRQRKFLEPNWCDYHPDAPVTIHSGEKVEWISARDLESDLILESGSELTISCRTAFPAKAKVIVHPAAKLVLDGAILTNVCDETWEGVEVWRQGKSKGEVLLLNGARIEKAEH